MHLIPIHETYVDNDWHVAANAKKTKSRKRANRKHRLMQVSGCSCEDGVASRWSFDYCWTKVSFLLGIEFYKVTQFVTFNSALALPGSTGGLQSSLQDATQSPLWILPFVKIFRSCQVEISFFEEVAPC